MGYYTPKFTKGNKVHYTIGGFDGTVIDCRWNKIAHSPNDYQWTYQLNVGVPGFWYEEKYLQPVRVPISRMPF